MTRLFFAVGSLGAFAAVAVAAPSVAIDLTGVQIKNATNQSRDSSTSSPSRIDAARHYRYEVTGLVKGDSGVLKTLYPNPTPVATVLEAFAPGASAGLAGESCNPGGTLPLVLGSDTQSGTTQLGLLSVTYGLTLTVGIRGDGVAYFDLTNVVLTPAFLVGSMSFTSGQARLTAFCAADFNADGFLTFEDFDAFVSAFEGGSASSDLNCDGFLTFEDFDAFVAEFEQGC